MFKNIKWELIDDRTAYLLDDIGRLGSLKQYKGTNEYEFVSRSDIEISDIEAEDMEDAIKKCTEEIYDFCDTKISTYNKILSEINKIK